MAQNGSNKKVANSLVAMSSAAVLAVYAAGYTRTRSAANRFEAQSAERRPAVPGPPRTAPPVVEPAIVPSTVASVPSNPKRDAADKPDPIASAAPVATKTDVPDGPAAPPPAEAPEPSSPAAPVAPVVPPVANQAAVPVAPAAEHKAEVAAVAPAAPAPAAPAWKDGTYLGWGTSRHGDIQAAVVIEGGRIASATIAQCWTRYSCSVIANLPPQVAQRQSPEVDFVSGATQSANAFYYGVVDALSKAK